MHADSLVYVNIRLKSNSNKNYEHKRLHGKSRESQTRVARLDQENGEKTPHNCRSRSLSVIIVPRLFEDIVFGFPSFRLSFRPTKVLHECTLCAQLLLQLYAASFETLQMFLSWSEDMHVVWILS